MSEDFIQVPPDHKGKRIRALKEIIAEREVYSETAVMLGKDYKTGKLVIVSVTEDGKLVLKVG